MHVEYSGGVDCAGHIQGVRIYYHLTYLVEIAFSCFSYFLVSQVYTDI